MSDQRDSNEGFDWIEAVASLAGLIGLSKVQVRWKLIRWRDRTRRAGDQVATRAEHVRYKHRSCPECGALNDGEARTCVNCGASMGSKIWTMFGRLGLSVPDFVSVSSVLCLLMVVIYLRMAVSGEGASLWGFDIATLIRHGGRWAPAIRAGDYWRLATPIFLHAGLWHIGFNVMALWQIGPALEELYGRGKMLLLFLATGILANVLGGLVSPAVGIGASGAIMGLIGLAAGWGHRDRTTVGREVRNRMIKWAVYVMIFGLFIHADNIAHGVGFASGFSLGYLIPVKARRAGPPRPLDVAAGVLGGALTLLCLALTLFPGKSTDRWATQWQTDAGHGQQTVLSREDMRAYYRQQLRACEKRASGFDAEAAELLAVSQGVSPDEKGWISEVYTPEAVDIICGSNDQQRRDCETNRREEYRLICQALVEVWPLDRTGHPDAAEDEHAAEPPDPEEPTPYIIP